MPSFFKILTVALYEFKSLMRSWLFRIFSFFAITIIILLNIRHFVFIRSATWQFRGISSSIPYMNVMLLNIFQAFIGIFIASEFLKHDKELNSTDAIYTRSMTNAEYVFGKSLGVFILFLCLNIFILLVALFINVIFVEDVIVIPVSYFYYPLLISIPTLIYISGLSFFCMGLLQSQPLTITILLGYIACTLFFIGKKFHNLFDYMAYNLPFMHSGFVGFGDIGTVFIHRGMYLLLGLGFIFATVLLLKRFPQSKIMNRVSFILAIVCIGSAFLLGDLYISRISSGRELRQQMKALNKEYAVEPRVSITDCNFDLIHKGKEIEIKAEIKFKNTTDSIVVNYIFSLNPGLEVQKVISSGNNINFNRNLHILTVEPSTQLQPGDIDSLIIHYRGTINEEASYINIDENVREENLRHFYNSIRKRYSFILPEYVLLTLENLWYPIAGVPYGSVYPETQAKDFVNFKLKVTTDSKLTAISQGVPEKTSDGEFVFRPDFPLPQLSLVIGEYEKKSITVDNVDYNIYIKVGHDYFSQYFNEIINKLPEEIKEMKQYFENRMNLTYPYKRFSLVEVPIHFYAYERDWTLCQDTVQPEQVFLPEKATLLNSADFRRNNER